MRAASGRIAQARGALPTSRSLVNPKMHPIAARAQTEAWRGQAGGGGRRGTKPASYAPYACRLLVMRQIGRGDTAE